MQTLSARTYARMKNFIVATLFILSSVLLPVGFTQNASAATLTWTGGGDGTSFSDGDNWNTASAPVDGDSLTFPYTVTTVWGSPILLENDLTDVTFSGLTIGDSDSESSSTYYQVDTLDFADGAVITDLPSFSTMSVSDSITAAGSVEIVGSKSPIRAVDQNVNVSLTDVTIRDVSTLCGVGGVSSFSVNWNPSATLTIENALYSVAPSTFSADEIIVGEQGVLAFDYSQSKQTLNADITFTSGGVVQGNGCPTGTKTSLIAYSDVTLAGTITLAAGDIKYYIHPAKTLTISGSLLGSGFELIAANGSTGDFVNSSSNNTTDTPGGTIEVPVEILPDIEDEQPEVYLQVDPKTIVTLKGSRGDILVSNLGVLKGTGIASGLYVDFGGIVAPGLSPGTLTILEAFNLYEGGTYQAELLNAGTYDQLRVGEDYEDTGNAVTLAGTLDTILYEGWSIEEGDEFTIIDNRSETAVSGTFDGLAEGEQFEIEGITFVISYEGGDGNDVFLTALNTGTDPDAPNTGIPAFIKSNPALVALVGVLGAATLLIAGRFYARSNRS